MRSRAALEDNQGEARSALIKTVRGSEAEVEGSARGQDSNQGEARSRAALEDKTVIKGK